MISAVDGQRHVFFDTSRAFDQRAIPRPGRVEPGPNDTLTLDGQRMTRSLSSTANLVARPGAPLRIESEYEDGVRRGQEVEVKVQLPRPGTLPSLTLPPVSVRVGWSGCPSVR